MAKASKKVVEAVNRALLASIATGGVAFATKDEAIAAGLSNNPPLVEVNLTVPDPNDANKVAIRVTEAGSAFLVAGANPVVETVVEPTASKFEIFTGAVLPPAKPRGGGFGAGAPKKYPFDEMEVGGFFFVAKSAAVPDPLKTLGSTVSSANLRFAEQIGEKIVTRAKRGKGNKLELDGNGQKIMETKTVPTWKLTRKFEIREVVGGTDYGTWKAPANGVLIARVA